MARMHEIDCIQREAAGFWRFRCGECNRTVLLRPVPFKQIVVVKGDEDATHLGFTVPDIRIGDPEITQELPDIDKDWLAAQGIQWE
jgi:hypothetical protein